MRPLAVFYLWRVFLLLSLLLGSIQSLRAQSTAAYWHAKPDSLRRVLAGQRADTARVRTLEYLADLATDPTDDLKQLLPLLRRLELPQYRAYRRWFAGLQLPQPWENQSHAARQAALDSVQAAVREFDRLGQSSKAPLQTISALYASLHMPEAARAYFKQQLARYQRQPAQWVSTDFCLGIIGFFYWEQGDYDHTIEYFLRNAELVRPYDQQEYYNLLLNVGNAYSKWGNYAKAQQYLQQVLRVYLPDAKKVQERKFVTYLLALLNSRQHRAAAALALLDQSLRIPDAIAWRGRDSASIYAVEHVFRSELLLDLQRPAEAGPLLAQAQHLARRYRLDSITMLQQLPLAATWARYYAQRGQPARAAAAWRRAYRQAQLVHKPTIRLEYARQIAQFYQAQYQPALAAPYALTALHLADSLTTLQGSSLVSRYEIVQADRAQAARLAQTQRQQRQAAARAQRQRRVLLYTAAGLVGLLLLAGVLYAAFRRSQRLAQLVTAQRDQLNTSLAELRATQAQLIQKEKMASLGELTAGIAHEIQNPLNFVNNFAEVSTELVAELKAAQVASDAAEVLALADDLGLNLTKISQHGQRASGIVRGMLEHSRQSTGERQPTDVNALGEEYLRLAYHGLRARDKAFNAELQTDLTAGLPLVEAVPGEVGRVLLNLLTNAFYAVQQRQRAGAAGYVPTVRVATRLAGQQVEIQVADNGTGMPAEVQQKIFQPFFTTKPTGEGTGLGLSLSYDIITQGHGGSLTVASQPGQGSTFTVLLPVRHSSSVPAPLTGS